MLSVLGTTQTPAAASPSFRSLATQLCDACARLDDLGFGPPVRSPEYAAYSLQHAKAAGAKGEALFGLQCLTSETATAAELERALVLTGGGKGSDLAWWLDGAIALERAGWAVGEQVTIEAPVRMGARAGDPMVASRDEWTGRGGTVMGMTPDGSDLIVRLQDGERVDVHTSRVSRV